MDDLGYLLQPFCIVIVDEVGANNSGARSFVFGSGFDFQSGKGAVECPVVVCERGVCKLVDRAFRKDHFSADASHNVCAEVGEHVSVACSQSSHERFSKRSVVDFLENEDVGVFCADLFDDLIEARSPAQYAAMVEVHAAADAADVPRHDLGFPAGQVLFWRGASNVTVILFLQREADRTANFATDAEEDGCEENGDEEGGQRKEGDDADEDPCSDFLGFRFALIEFAEIDRSDQSIAEYSIGPAKRLC